MIGSGSLVAFKSNNNSYRHVKGWDSFPGEYGYKTALWTKNGTLGIVLSCKDRFCLVYVGMQGANWFEIKNLIEIS